MFEKEAEKKYCKGCKLRMEQCLWAWRNTNGLKEPNEKNCSCKEVPAYIAGFQDGYNKANEWHYVKSEEDLPKDNSEYLLLLEHGIRVFGYYNGKWWESWKGDLSWQEVQAYFFVPVPELPKEIK